MTNKNKGIKKLAEFIKSTGIFFIGSSLSKMIGFFLLPIYTAYISTEDFGYYDLSITYLTVVVELIYFDIWVSALRFMYDEKEEKGKPIKAAGGIFLLSTIVYVVLMSIAIAFTKIKYLPLITVVGLLQAVTSFYTFISRGLKKNIDFSISGIICTGTAAFLNIVMIAYLNMDFSALYYSLIVGYIAQIVYLEIRVKILRRIKYSKFDINLIKKIFIYTLPLGLNAVAFWILNSFNRVAINNIMSISDNGIYAVGQKFANMLAFAITCFTYAWQDFAFSEGNSKDNGKFYTLACTVYFSFLCLAISLLMPAIKIIFPVLVNGDYSSASQMIPISLMAAAMSGFSTFVGNIFYAIKNTKIIFISTVVSCIVNLICVYPFIHLWGLNGANISILLSFFINVIIRYFILRKEIGIQMKIKYYLLVSGIVVLSTCIYHNTGYAFNVLWGVILFIGLSVFVYRFIKGRK